MKPIISIEGLGKSYLIGHNRGPSERYTALRDVVGRELRKLSRNAWDMARGRQIVQGEQIEEFWALEDVSFDIELGEVVGIVGHNGAGKSTLLKVLSRITEPSAGRVTIRGRLASLLEVGTGFHPELTGRENIFLNGAILGMTKQQIRKHFDAIVDFAEVEQFLDTPVKRYSSGMYVRLAFAVAAFLESEILVVDEVLAVGDVAFQRKCLGRMSEISSAGRTVLFVSHNLASVLNLCTRGVHLHRGRVELIGTISEAVSSYTQVSGTTPTTYKPEKDANPLQSPYFTLESFALHSEALDRCAPIEASANEIVRVQVSGQVESIDERFNIGFSLVDEQGNVLMISYSTDQEEQQWPQYRVGRNTLEAAIDTSSLNEGRYYVYLLASLHCVRMLCTNQSNCCVSFEVVGNRGNSPYWINKRASLLAPKIAWNVVSDPVTETQS